MFFLVTLDVMQEGGPLSTTLDNGMRKILGIMRGRNNQKKPLCLRQYQGQEIDLTPANGISITHTR